MSSPRSAGHRAAPGWSAGPSGSTRLAFSVAVSSLAADRVEHGLVGLRLELLVVGLQRWWLLRRRRGGGGGGGV